jgi:hypothetical protein
VNEGAKMLKEARENPAAISAEIHKVFNQMRTACKPIGVEKLPTLMLQAGIDPDDNIGSWKILAMQEE